MMRNDVRFNLLRGMLTICVMAGLGLLLDVVRAFLYDVGSDWRERAVLTFSMTVVGCAIALAQSISFYWKRRQSRL